MADRTPRAVAIVGGVVFVGVGVWAMVDPHSFFEAIATRWTVKIASTLFG